MKRAFDLWSLDDVSGDVCRAVGGAPDASVRGARPEWNVGVRGDPAADRAGRGSQELSSNGVEAIEKRLVQLEVITGLDPAMRVGVEERLPRHL